MYPKNRLKTQQMPPNLVTLFAHVMSRANEGGSRGSAAHGWDEVLNPAPAPSPSSASTSSSASSSSSSGTTSPGPCCPMSAQDWRKAEAFSAHLQSLLAARQTLYNSHSNGSGPGAAAAAASAAATATGGGPPHSNGTNGQAPPSSFSAEPRLSTPHANGGRAKGGRAKPPIAASDLAAATPNPESAWPRQHAPRVTPKEPSRGSSGEPSAPVKAVGRVAASRRVNGSAEGAVASLAVSRAGPGAFETPAHATSHHHHHHHHHLHPGRAGAGLPGADNADLRGGREHSPSRYPARLRSRRFPQLGGGGESPDTPQPRGLGHHGLEGADDGHAGDHSQGGRRLSPRSSPPALLVHEHGRRVSSDDWLVAAAGGTQKGAASGGGGSRGRGGEFAPLAHDVNGYEEDGVGSGSGSGNTGGGGGGGESYGMRTRAAPKASHELDSAAAVPSSGASSSPLPGACTPQMGTGALVSPEPMGFRPAPPPIISASAAAAAVAVTAAVRPSPRVELVAPRPRQVLQGGRSGGRAAPLLRSSVGGRNYTDNHVKQLGLIEAAVVASATARDRATYNLPRQGRTLTLTNIFKFIALHGAGAMYRLAMDKQVEAHTGRHSNFFDGKIDARIVGVIKKDIGDEVITKSRKFSKILLSLIAEGCSHPDCDWDHTSFTSDKIANLQARIEARTGTSTLKFCSDPAVFLAHAAAAAAASTGAGGSAGSSARGGGGGSIGGGSIGGAGAGGNPSLPLGTSAFSGGSTGSSGSGSNGSTGGAHSKRRLDLGRDDDAGQTPSPRLKKLKRAAKARVAPTAGGGGGGGGGVESTPNGDGNGNSKSPPKEEDDMRAAEVLQGLKDVVGGQ